MWVPSIIGESLFDEFLDDFFDVPEVEDKEIRRAQKNLYGRNAANIMKTDVQEHDDHYEVDIDLPGFKKDELSLELKDGYLMISAAKGVSKDEKDEKTGRYVRRERFAGNVSRSFYVGEEMKQEDIHAKFEDGVLKLSLPKLDKQKAQIEDKRFISIE